MASPNPTKRGVVLVADDDPVMRLLMLEMLGQVGLDGIEAEDGAQAVAYFQSMSPDLILLDVEMPNMDGFSACREIRRIETGAPVPIIMVTGGDDIEAVTNAYEVGATDFVSKPINWPILGHRVLYVLRASDAIVRLRMADAHNRAVLAAIPDTFFRLNRDGFYLDYEPGHERQGHDAIAAFPTEACVGKHITEVLPREIAERLLEQMRGVLDTQHIRSVDYELVRFGVVHHFEARLVATGASEVLGLVRDISERKRTEEQIRRLAYCDSLTGIPNRQAFLETLERELHRSKVGNKKFAVLFMDLDAFKRINDTLGHNVGDHLLKVVSERLRETIRPSDLVSRGDQSHNLARLGGDEFTILIPGPRAGRARAQRRAPRQGSDAPPLPHRRQRDLRHRQHRHLAVPGRRRRLQFAAQVRRHRDVPRQELRQEQRQAVQLIADDADHEPREARSGPAQGAQERGAVPAVPAADRSAHRRDRRRRGAGALAPSGARHHLADRIHPAGRGDRPDRADRRMGAAHRLQPGQGVAARWPSARSGWRSTCRPSSSRTRT